MNHQGSNCCPNFLTGTPSYNSKMTPIGALLAEKWLKQFALYFYNSITSVPLEAKKKAVKHTNIYKHLQLKISFNIIPYNTNISLVQF